MPSEPRASKRRIWKIPPSKLAVVMSPKPEGDQYVTHHKTSIVRPFVGKEIKPGQEELVLYTGRDKSQVHLPVPWHASQGPTQSKIHGPLVFKLVEGEHGGKVINRIIYSDVGREGVAVYMLPRGTNSVRDIFDKMGQSQPHNEAPHLQAADITGQSSVEVVPNKTVLVFGVPKGTVRDKHLFPGKYKDEKGVERAGFFDENGNTYPWMAFYADKKKFREER